MAGCGYEGSPLPPLANVPGRVTDLSATQRGTRLLVQFTPPQLTTEGFPVKPPLDLDVRLGPGADQLGLALLELGDVGQDQGLPGLARPSFADANPDAAAQAQLQRVRRRVAMMRKALADELVLVPDCLDDLAGAHPFLDELGEADAGREEIGLLWLTSPLRVKPIGPADEVRTVMAVFDDTLFGLAPAFYRALDQACGANPELRHEIESLLKAHDASGGFLQEAPLRPSATEDYAPITERPGTVIGPYKLMELIGEGGFGLVFVAEQ